MFKYSNSKNVLVEYDLADANLDDDQLKDRLAGMKIKLELAFDDKQTTTTTNKTVKNEPNIEHKAVKSSLSHVAKANQSYSSRIKEEKALVFEKWNIRKCDVIGIDAITTNDDQVLPVTTRLKLSGRFFQFGGLHSNAFSIEFSSKGIVRFILREELYDIKIAIGILDIAYIACMFDYPFYAISFCVNDSAVDVYLNDLKNLDRYDHNLKLDNKSRSQIIALIDIEQEEEESDLIDKLHSYFAYQFSSQKKDFNKLVGFLSPTKSKEIIANAFIERKSLPKEVTSFLNDYRMAQTVSVESGLSVKNLFEKSASRNFSGTFLSERIYIGNISRLVNEAELKDLFQSFGKIYDICIIRKPRGPDQEFTFGYITYYESESAHEAIKSMNGFYICGRALKVEPAKPN